MSPSPNLLSNTPTSDDPWNQTAADNFEWLRRFKRDIGLLTDPSLPGLPPNSAWSTPTSCPNPSPPHTITPTVNLPTPTPFPILGSAATAQGPTPSPTDTTKTPPSTTQAVFCSQALERGLSEYVTTSVLQGSGFPSDSQLRERARQVLGQERTVLDQDGDGVLVGRFREVMRGRLGLSSSGGELDGGFEGLDDGLMQVVGEMDFEFGDFLGVETGGVEMDLI